jgi:trans-aconitate methyltransferase
MQPKDNERLQKFYKEALAIFGDHDARSVHWSGEEGQRTRFLVLSQVANLNHQSVLDVGCGLGDLYKFFIDQKIDVDYTGIDIIPDFIARTKERFPDGHFECKDITAVTKTYDVVLASGALSFKVTDSQAYNFSVIKKMYDVAKTAVAFNMLNRATHVDDDVYATYNPTEVATFCKTFCPRVEIITDYLPQDFTIYLYK